ncbi:type IV pilus biogenesis/stability protein PilW [Thiohalomonas denitrificans]|uniref:Type IV pilus assembly protein PilF n=1 Tax=Thiohalomonas denitrificans TaxID=415747 RepID=A0A1G5Q1R6_9GAMM|nr:type IV pilus biogenesis/stability protein PilW [Thiohalomonas denitrificans]SCZ55496.1 type IV pilus assembly protein PilF [Thiohalomonas denitrificans]
MRRVAAILILGAGLALAGCAGTPTQHAEKSAEVNAQMGLRYMQQGNNERAMEKLQRALSFDQRHGGANHYLAILYQRLDRPEDAEVHFRRAIRALPDDSSLLNNFGAFLCSSGQYEEGEGLFLEVLDDPVYPQRPAVHENLGLCKTRQGNLQEAETYLRKALSQNPRMHKSLFGMADLSYQKGNYLSARAYLQRYRDVARHTPQSLWLGIRIERELGDRDALSSYEMHLKNRFPDSRQARLLQESEQ